MRSVELLDAVLESPHDFELRRVYGDALVEEGHPHGELIALQFARLDGRATDESAAREKLLLERFGPDILGPLIAVVDRYEIERGFVRMASIPSHRPAYNVERVAGHRSWATVEELQAPPVIYLHEVMRALRSLTTDYGDRALAELCAGTTARPIERLECLMDVSRLPAAVFDCAALPALQTLCIDSIREPEQLARFEGAPIARRLAHLEIGARNRTIDQWHAEITRVRPAETVTLRYVHAATWWCRFELVRGERGYDHVRATCRYQQGWAPANSSIAALLGRIERLDVVVERGYYAVPPSATAELAEIVARFPVSSFTVRS